MAQNIPQGTWKALMCSGMWQGEGGEGNGSRDSSSLRWDFFLESSGELLLGTRHPNVSKTHPAVFTQTPLFRGKDNFQSLEEQKTPK